MERGKIQKEKIKESINISITSVLFYARVNVTALLTTIIFILKVLLYCIASY